MTPQRRAAVSQRVWRVLSSAILVLGLAFGLQSSVSAASGEPWQSPLKSRTKLGSPLVEVTPFVFHDRLYLLENWQKQWEFPGSPDGSRIQEDEVRIRDVELDKVVSVPLRGHGLGMAFVWNDRVHVFAGNWGGDKKWNIHEIETTSSADLLQWSKPEVILKAEPQEKFFNVSVCRGAESFALLVESNDPRWPAFTFKYFTSPDLRQWTPVPNGLYGTNKYVGGPALYFEGGRYYTLYLESLGDSRYETRVARSTDLVRWEDAPAGRPFVTFNPTNSVHPLRPSSIRERNASDAELVYWKGRTLVYFTGGDQQLAGDLQRAEFAGTPRQLLESFFEPAAAGGGAGVDWGTVVSTPPGESRRSTLLPSARQMAYQEAQFGGFIHFGMPTFDKGNMLSTPPASRFKPDRLDVSQWVRGARSFGAQHVVLTAKHHDGFCLWPTATTDYSVKSAPWKDGRGDVVAEFVKNCVDNRVLPGIYVSAGDMKFGCSSSPDPLGKRVLRGNRDAYFPVFLQQLRELLTGYGPLAVIWIDGAYDPFGWDVMDPTTGKVIGTDHARAIQDLVHSLQPGAVLFSGFTPDVRWSGSEEGEAPYPLWNVVLRGEGVAQWVAPESEGWMIPESNLHTRSGWFWTAGSDSTLLSTDRLLRAYMDSIGRGANLLINVTPDTTGSVPDLEIERLASLGLEISRRVGHPVALMEFPSRWTPDHAVEVDLEGERMVDHVSIEEDLRRGQRVRGYEVEVLRGGTWQRIAAGSTIGRLRIEAVSPVMATRVRVRVTKADAVPVLRRISVYRTLEPGRLPNPGE